jgi:hypothetical protein
MNLSAVIPGSMLIALAMAGCTAVPTGGPSDGPDPSDEPTFASLGIDDWPAEFDPLADAPAPPAELDAARYEQLTAAIAGFAQVSAVDADLRELDDPIPELTARLQDPFARLIPLVVEQETSPRVTLMNYFGEGIDVVAGPLVQHVWDVRQAADGAGTTITLQTWAAYEVTGDGGATVIGVYREYYRTEADNGTTGASWETAGVDTCALAVDDAIAPDAGDEQRGLLSEFASEGEEHAFADREVAESITEEFKQSCLDAG